jgi:hypothetical protein
LVKDGVEAPPGLIDRKLAAQPVAARAGIKVDDAFLEMGIAVKTAP